MAKKAASTKTVVATKVLAGGLTRVQIEAKLLNKKMRSFLWSEGELVGIVAPDGTTIEFENAKVK